MMSASTRAKVAVCIPCLNEEMTVAQVVRHFRSALPDAAIYVFDNASTDATVTEALAAGARVITVFERGKGVVVDQIFQLVDADVVVMTDGDATYPADRVTEIIAPVVAGQADMVVGSRLHRSSNSDFFRLNRWGNLGFVQLLNVLFGSQLTDLFSGYRAFSRGFARRVSVQSRGFEVETELTIRALIQGERIVELPIDLRARPPGSHSKLRVVRDGLIILWTILKLFLRTKLSPRRASDAVALAR